MVSRKNINRIGLLLAVILAIMYRTYRIQENFIFSGEVGDNLLAIKNAMITHQIPLLGPPTSHPWLSFGPLFYWIMGPVLWIFKFNPMSTVYFSVFLSIITLFLNYFVVKKIFNQSAAFLSTFLIVISPLWMQFTRDGRFFSFVLPFIYILIWAIHERKFFIAGLSLGIMLNFHYTPLIFIPIVLSMMFFLRKEISLKKTCLRFFTGLLIPTLPLLIYDFSHGFKMTTNLILWIPYRIAGFVGLYPKNTVSESVIHSSFSTLYQFLNLSFLPLGNGLAIILILILFIYTVVKVRQPLLLLWLGWGLFALFIHGDPPLHYFLPLFPLPIIILSLFLTDLKKKKFGRLVMGVILLFVGLSTYFYYYSNSWFYLPQDRIWPNTFYIPYNLQVKIVKDIIKDAHWQKYNLSRIGPYDYFDQNYAQNYKYLAWYLGNEPVKEKAKLHYTICEEQKRCLKQPKIFKVASVSVFK